MSKAKKWTIALAVIVLIAVIAVVLIVCLPKNVQDVKDRAFKEQEISFLQTDEDLNLYNSFVSKIEKDAPSYKQDAENARTVSYMLVNVLDFYNDNLVFAKDNNTFQSEYRVVLDNFNKVNSYEKSMRAILKEVNDYVGSDAPTYITGSWQKFEKEFKNYLASYTKVLDGLGKVYIDCVPKGINNNAFTSLVVTTMTDYLNVLTDATENYSSVLTKANTFVNRYIVTTTNMQKYEFSDKLKGEVAKINKFASVYKENITAVIKSINGSQITYKTIDADKDGILVSLKSFLEGGINA